MFKIRWRKGLSKTYNEGVKYMLTWAESWLDKIIKLFGTIYKSGRFSCKTNYSINKQGQNDIYKHA